jgi:hypothetical protein
MAVAIFAMGAVFSYSIQGPINKPQQTQVADHTKDGGSKSAVTSDRADPNERIADYTFWLTWLTLGMAVATGGLWLVAVRTARRQLRAYVTLDEALIVQTPQQHNFEAHVILKNYGQTPAYRFGAWINLEIANSGQIIVELPAEIRGRSIIGPNAHAHQRVDFEIAPPILVSILNRTITMIVYGIVEYRDTFKIERTLHYRLTANGPVTQVQIQGVTGWGWALQTTAEGYRED